MSDRIKEKFEDMLDQQLRRNDLELVDIVAIPQHTDRMVRLRTLKEVIEDFDGPGSEDMVGYFVQVRPTRAKAPEAQPAPVQAQPAQQEAVFVSEGKLNVPYLIRNAELLLSAGDFALAKNVFKTVLTSGEKTSQALFGIAQCLEAEGKLTEAKHHYEESIAYHPALESYRRLGLLLARMNKDQEAAEVLSRALNLKDLTPAARYDLHKACGNAFTRSKKADQAEKHFKKALELNPAADEIRTSMGALCIQTGKTSEARRHFQDALAANPKSAQALMGLGSCFLADGEKRMAHDCFAKSLEADLNNPAAVFHLVKCAYEIKSYVTAARVLEEYIQVAPVNSNLMYSLAGLQFHLGRMNESRATARKILELQPSHSGASELLKAIERNITESSS